MNKSPISKRLLIFSFTFSAVILLIVYLINYFDNNTYITFCSVGQGDATHIRVKNKVDILIDAGPDRSILNCLGKHMPFFDRQIEIAILSHPQKDHYGGFNYVIDRYRIGKFMTINTTNSKNTFQTLVKKLKEKHISIYTPTADTRLRILDSEIFFLWPDKNFLKSSVFQENNASFVLQFKENNYKVLFTGDIDAMVLNKLIEQAKSNLKRPSWLNTSILKFPHHGSKNGLSLSFLKLANPAATVISAGKNNIYGHPSIEVIEALQALGKKYLRTDLQGDITFKIRNTN